MPLRSAEYQRGYDAGYKQALLDALKSPPLPRDMMVGPDPHRHFRDTRQQLRKFDR